MPATYAHYKFGKAVYRSLPKEIRQILKENRAAYLLGLHGPDLVFYYRPFGKNRVNQLGVRMHKEKASGFFETGRRRYQERPSYVLLSYLCGFLCHFILDSECHPYVNYYMEEQELGHLEIETEFDRYLMELDGKNPLHDIPVHHLLSRKHTREQISAMFRSVTPKQIGICICLFRLVIAFFVCANPVKRAFLKILSRITGQDKSIGGLIVDGKIHPACKESNWFLERRMEHAAEIAAEEIRKYKRVLESGGLLSDRLYRNYEEPV